MKRLLLIAFLAAIGCAGTQSRNAFTLRPAAPEYGPLSPNHAKADDARLRKAIDDSIDRQELLDEVRASDGGVRGR